MGSRFNRFRVKKKKILMQSNSCVLLILVPIALAKVSEMDMLRQEIFLQKLATGMEKVLKSPSHRSKRNSGIIKIETPPRHTKFPLPDLVYYPFEEETGEELSSICGRRNVTVNFDSIGWGHILAPKQWKL